MRAYQEIHLRKTYHHSMTTLNKSLNLIAVAVPAIALVVAIVLLWHHAIGPLELVTMGVMYFITGFGVTVGFHRMFTHRSYESSRTFRAIIAVLGSMSLQGSVITWVADHRKHHQFSDHEGDPHSPRLAGPGLIGALKGLWHAHIGWLFMSVGRADKARYAKDLLKDPVICAIDRLFPLWTALSLLIPFAVGYVIGGTLDAALLTLLWGGAVRILVLHHVTWSVNSVCHFFGRRRFQCKDQATNVAWLSLISMGENWHHNHHTFPTSAFHGLSFWERVFDPSGWLIAILEKLGVIWNVVRISPERQAATLSSAVAAAAAAAVGGISQSEAVAPGATHVA